MAAANWESTSSALSSLTIRLSLRRALVLWALWFRRSVAGSRAGGGEVDPRGLAGEPERDRQLVAGSRAGLGQQRLEPPGHPVAARHTGVHLSARAAAGAR